MCSIPKPYYLAFKLFATSGANNLASGTLAFDTGRLSGLPYGRRDATVRLQLTITASPI